MQTAHKDKVGLKGQRSNTIQRRECRSPEDKRSLDGEMVAKTRDFRVCEDCFRLCVWVYIHLVLNYG